jgi:glutamyl-tRNA synthetase
VERAASAPHADHEGPTYPGTCAGRAARDVGALGQTPHAWRFRLPERTPLFTDVFRGPSDIELARNGGDFVVWKSAGTPAYQLAVVVDDAAQSVTEVIRGDDLLVSTPRQLLLYQSLGLEPPCFAHVPLVVGPDGRRLAKRHGDTCLSALRAASVQPQRLLGLLAWSCGWIERCEPVSIDDLLGRYSLTTIPSAPFVLTPDHLRAIGYG